MIYGLTEDQMNEIIDEVEQDLGVGHGAWDTVSARSIINSVIRRYSVKLAANHLGCSRSHPHELMSPMCELRTEIARLSNKLAAQPEQPSPTSDINTAQVVTDERAAFERWFDEYHNNACDEFGGIDGTNPKGIAEDAWQGAILALASQPEQSSQAANSAQPSTTPTKEPIWTDSNTLLATNGM